jgi:putative endonuclease
VGRDAEEAVCAYLGKRGIRIVERNFRSRGGEIDIIAREGEVLAFVEVRFREEDGHGLPEESVGAVKRRRIATAARAYLATVPPDSWREARFDVAAVDGGDCGPVIRYYDPRPGTLARGGGPLAYARDLRPLAAVALAGTDPALRGYYSLAPHAGSRTPPASPAGPRLDAWGPRFPAQL